MPAWLDASVSAEDWAAVARAVAMQRVEALVSGGRELGLAVAADVLPPAQPWCVAQGGGAAAAALHLLALERKWGGARKGVGFVPFGEEIQIAGTSKDPDIA